MLANRVAVTVLRKALLNNGAAASSQLRHSHAPAHYKEPSMDELPVPQGSWQEDYNAKQNKYNLQLALGVSALAGTVGFIVFSDLYDFNYRIPEYKKVEALLFTDMPFFGFRGPQNMYF